MKKVKIMFAVIQPPHDGKRPFAKDYHFQTKIVINSLINTGFPRKDIVCIADSVDYVQELKEELGIQGISGPDKMPAEFDSLLARRPKAYYYYKPVAFYAHGVSAVQGADLVSWCDVDGVWKKNPLKYLSKQKSDIWAYRGKAIPYKRKDNKPVMRKPQNNVADLAEYYHHIGGKTMATLQLKYGWKLPKIMLNSGMVCVKHRYFQDLVSTWYSMCLEAISDVDYDRGDMEVLSAAAWRMGLSISCPRKYEFRKKYYMHNHAKTSIKQTYRKLYKKLPSKG